MWILCLVTTLFGLSAVWSAISGNSDAAGNGVAYLLFALLLGRFAICGVVLVEVGIKLRTTLRTRHLRWEEIEDFELRGTVFRPNLLVKLIDGRVVGAPGLEARTKTEERRAREALDELKGRLTKPRQ